MDLEPGETTERTFTLEPPAPAWRARVEDDRGFPVDGAMIEATTLDRGPRQRGFDVTTDEGSFEMPGLGGRPLRVMVAHPAHATLRIERIDANDEVRIVMGPPAGIAVTVTDERTGEAVSNPQVELRPRAGPPSRAVGTADGKAELTNMPPGAYSVVVRAAGYAEARAAVELPAPRGLERTTAELEIALVPGATAAGEVVDARGDPVAGARVSVGQGAGVARGPGPPPGSTDLRGRFTLAGLPAGDVRLVATHPGLGETETTVRLRAGDTVDDVRLRFDTRLSDVIVDAPTGVGVAIELEGARPIVRAVAPGSAAEEAGIEPGDVVVKVDGRAVRTGAAAAAALAGPEGTEAVIELRREGEAFEAIVRREAIRR